MKALVIGYGNSLRGDDGLGPRIACALDGTLGLRVLGVPQLAPELAEEVFAASRVVFVDAAAGLDPGEIAITVLRPATALPAALVHHLTPEAVLALAKQLYGRAAPAWLVTVGAACMDLQERLSPQVTAALPAVVTTVRGLLMER